LEIRHSIKKLKMEGFFTAKEVQSTSRPDGKSLTCISQEGLAELLLPFLFIRSTKPEVQDRIQEFQQWVKSTLIPKKEVHIENETLSLLPIAIPHNIQETINTHLDVADIIIKRCNVPKETAYSFALTQAGEELETDDLNVYANFLSRLRKNKGDDLSLPPAPELSTYRFPVVSNEEIADYEKHFSAGKLAKILNVEKTKVINLLEEKRIICWQNNHWHLTRFGETYGKMFETFPECPYLTHSQIVIKYNPDAKKLLEDYFGGNTTQTRIQET